MSGHRVFPVAVWDKGRKKRPLIKRYFGDVPFSADEMARMPWHAATHIGLAVPRATVVLDVDVKDGKAGKAHLDALQASLGPLPATARQMTPSGGFHLAFTTREFPRDRALAAKVSSLDGTGLDIDILHPRYRFVTLYEPERLVGTEETWAEIPRAYHDSLAVRELRWRDIPSVTDGFRPVGRGLAALVEAIRRARVGERNNVLFMCASIAQTCGYVTSRERGLLFNAARSAGLSDDEIAATLESAERISLEREREIRRWEVESLRNPRIFGSRQYECYSRVVAAIADVARIDPTSRAIGLPVRDLATRAGVTKNTANKHLRHLVEIGQLDVRTQAGLGTGQRYALRHSDESNEWKASDWDSQAVFGELAVVSNNARPSQSAATAFEETQALLRRREARLTQHSAFMRSPRGLYWPASAAAILIALELGFTDVDRIAAITALSTRTVRERLRGLAKHGLVRRDEASRDWGLAHGSAQQAVEWWAARHAIPRRAEQRLAMYDAESRAYARQWTPSRASGGRQREVG